MTAVSHVRTLCAALLVTACAVGASGTLVACADSDRLARPNTDSEQVGQRGKKAPQEADVTQTDGPQARDGRVDIVVAAGDVEKRALAHIYRMALLDEGIPAVVEARETTQDERMEWLTDPGVDMVIGCTGELLTQRSPHEAEQLRDQLTAGAIADPVQATYEALAATLSYQFDVPDPSPASGCRSHSPAAAGSHASTSRDALPESFIPIFRKTAVARERLKGINRITRLVPTADIEKIVAEAGTDPSRVDELGEQWFRDNAGS